MNNLTIAVIAVAVAQVLTMLLTIGREREIRRLRELVTEHRIQIAEIKAWLAGRLQSAQPRRIKPGREPRADDMRVPEPAITPKDLPDTIRPSTTEDELERATKAFKWFKEDADEAREIVAGLQTGLQRGAPPNPAITRVPEPAVTPKDLPETIRPSTTEDELKRATKAFNWSREIVAGLQTGLQRAAPPEPAITPKDLPDTIRPSTTEDELERATKAINWLNEDVDKARAIVAAQQVNQVGPVMPLEVHTAKEVDAEVAPHVRSNRRE